MSEELYSYDKYKGFDIFIEDESHLYSYAYYCGAIYQNGVCWEHNIKALSSEKCLEKCKDKVDAIIHCEGEYKDDE